MIDGSLTGLSSLGWDPLIIGNLYDDENDTSGSFQLQIPFVAADDRK